MRNILSKLSTVIAAGAVLCVGTSCTDLTETPYTEITQANFHPTAADLAALDELLPPLPQ